MADRTPLEDYRRVRPIADCLTSLAYHKVRKADLEYEADLIGLRNLGQFHFEAETEADVLFSHVAHDGSGGDTPAMALLTKAEVGALGDEAPRLWAGMVKARLGIFLLKACRPGLGWEVRDLCRPRTTLLVDETLSSIPEAAGMMGVFRLVDMDGWSFAVAGHGSTFSPEAMVILLRLLTSCPVPMFLTGELDPATFSAAKNLIWSRCLLRAWLRPGAVDPGGGSEAETREGLSDL